MTSRRLMKLFLFMLPLAGAAEAAVPNRITYQGRLSQSGAPKGGSHDFELKLVNPSNGADVWASTSVTKTLPPTGDFSLTLEVSGDRDWLGVNPVLELKVDGSPMNPNEVLSAAPYAFAAKVAERVLDLPDFPVFSAYSDQAQVFPQETWVLVNFNQEEFDSHGAYAPANGRFAPSVAGYYELCASVATPAIDISKSMEFCFAKNGGCWKAGALSDQGSGGPARVTGCAIGFANGSTDYFEVRAYYHGNAGITLSGGPIDFYFQGHRIK